MKKNFSLMVLFCIYNVHGVSFENFDELLDILTRDSPITNIPAPANLVIDGVTYNLSNFSKRKNAFAKMRGFFVETQQKMEELKEQVEAGADAGEMEELQNQLDELTRQSDEEKEELQQQLDDLRAEYEEFQRQVIAMISNAQGEVAGIVDNLVE